MLHKFPKVRSTEQIFLSEKRGVLGIKILKICILGAETLAKNKAEKVKFFFSIIFEQGAHEQCVAGKWVCLGVQNTNFSV